MSVSLAEPACQRGLWKECRVLVISLTCATKADVWPKTQKVLHCCLRPLESPTENVVLTGPVMPC
eukprot:3324664-Amphidinium_carterae.1